MNCFEVNKKRWLHFGYINIIDEMDNAYKTIKIAKKRIDNSYYLQSYKYKSGV